MPERNHVAATSMCGVTESGDQVAYSETLVWDGVWDSQGKKGVKSLLLSWDTRLGDL